MAENNTHRTRRETSYNAITAEDLTFRETMSLFCSCTAKLEVVPNVQELSLPSNSKCLLIGDLHGNLQDLHFILSQIEEPGPNNFIIFNGDYVDRGDYSLEVIIVILKLFSSYPNYVFINRGNHEDMILNQYYGFFEELSKKFSPDQAESLKVVTSNCFKALPLCTIIDNTILVCHGGISPNLKIEDLRALDRTKLKSVLNPESDIERMSIQETSHWQQVLELLWSDPMVTNGYKPNLARGSGCYFGPDVTDEFLTNSNLSLIIRSHECCLEGFKFHHSKKVITLFSASNYNRKGGNLGAYLVLTREPYSSSHSQASQQESVLSALNNVSVQYNNRTENMILKDIHYSMKFVSYDCRTPLSLVPASSLQVIDL
ncbi:protein phosphatase, EF-hand calcium binding domain [Cichlidogyrus casuarinus]|uniref:Serine/threonine-protein phosphatase n=1 Tax=Cichlidogyrus casuarinus TaxID=1844966 RepID=A0ABD2QN34_9PLAT